MCNGVKLGVSEHVAWAADPPTLLCTYRTLRQSNNNFMLYISDKKTI